MLLKKHFDLVVTCQDPQSIPCLMAERELQAIMLDMNFRPGDNSGEEGLRWLNRSLEIDQNAVVILVTAFSSVDAAVEAMKLGAYDYIQKPFSAEEICILVDRALQHGMLRRENEALRESLRDVVQDKSLIGGSEVFARVRAQIERVANSNATVLVQGDSGTGKEMVARAILHHSPRKDKPFLAVNCAAIPDTLLESELFGHEKGAFTGADVRRVGKFEQCDGGTLFWTRSETSHSPRRPSCFASFRTAPSSASEARA